MKKALVAAVALIAVIGFTGVAAAQTATNFADSTDGSVTGGNTSNTNLTADRVTTDWAGFYGTLDQTVSLSDAGTFYEWTASDVTGAAILASSGSFDGDIASLSTVTDPDSVSGVPTVGTEKASNTYTSSGTLTDLSLNATNSTSVNFGSASNFQNFLYQDDDNGGAAVYAAEAIEDGTAYNGDTADYQLLAGTNGGGSQTFSFYAQIE